jgi:hypothetical protein
MISTYSADIGVLGNTGETDSLATAGTVQVFDKSAGKSWRIILLVDTAVGASADDLKTRDAKNHSQALLHLWHFPNLKSCRLGSIPSLLRLITDLPFE